MSIDGDNKVPTYSSKVFSFVEFVITALIVVFAFWYGQLVGMEWKDKMVTKTVISTTTLATCVDVEGTTKFIAVPYLVEVSYTPSKCDSYKFCDDLAIVSVVNPPVVPSICTLSSINPPTEQTIWVRLPSPSSPPPYN